MLIICDVFSSGCYYGSSTESDVPDVLESDRSSAYFVFGESRCLKNRDNMALVSIVAAFNIFAIR